MSPKWMGPTILALLILGALMIVLNYFDVLPVVAHQLVPPGRHRPHRRRLHPATQYR